MPRLQFSVVINAPRETVWKFYDDVKTLPQITPPWTIVRLISPAVPMRRGARFLLRIVQPPIPLPLVWETIITDYAAPERFVDEQGATGPFAYWHHEHVFEHIEDGRTQLTDTIIYELPLGMVGLIVAGPWIKWQLTMMFRYRHRRTREVLESPYSESV